MQILIIPAKNPHYKQWQISTKSILLVLLLILVLFVVAVFGVAHKSLQSLTDYYQNQLSSLAVNQSTKQDIPKQALVSSEQFETKVPDFYAVRLGKLQAESIRLKAISEQLASMAGLDLADFMLQQPPAQGGIEGAGQDVSQPGFESALTELSSSIQLRQQQLQSLESYLITNDNIQSTIPSTRPIHNGWLSSPYGYRIDPFDGKRHFHKGVDFAAKEGSSIIAVADGIVSWTGSRDGYGNTVEIDHGNGYVTRYAHSKKLLVNQGDKVERGQQIALIGSTGRSTGPHVHFEVLQDGKIINPHRFLK